MTPITITILCVNYHSDDYLQRYLQSIEAARKRVENKIEVQVLVADNSIHNRGYFGGIRYLLQQNSISSDWLIISNVDLLLSEDFFEQFLTLSLPNDLGGIAPSIRSLTENQERNPEYDVRPSRRRLQLARLIYWCPLTEWLYRILIYNRRPRKQTPAQTAQIYAAHGSFLMYKNLPWIQQAIIHFQPFLYCEEIYMAECLRQHQLSTYFYPQLHVTDFDHVSTSKLSSRTSNRYHLQGLNFILANYDA